MNTIRITLPGPIDAEMREQASIQGITIESFAGNWLIETWLNRTVKPDVSPQPKPLPVTPRKAKTQGPVEITLRFDKLGGGKAEIIRCANMADALVKVVTTLYSNLGVHVLEQLSVKKFTRGKITSKNPSLDFKNKSTGQIYGNERIIGSEFYVRTHSSTDEKLEQFKEIQRELGLPRDFIEVR